MRPRIWWSWASPILSASSMMSVFTLGMSMPVSMMVVQTRMSASPSTMACMTEDSSCSVIFPWPVTMRTSGPSIFWSRAAVASILSTRLWR